MSNSRQIASLPNILTLIDDAGGQFIKQQAAGVTTSYTITWPSAVGSSGAVLALTDGSGGLGWQSTLGIALSGGTVNNSVIGGSTPAAITGTTITANSGFVGSLTGNADTATALATGRTFSFTGDATGTSGAFTGAANASTALTLAASGVSAGSYGGSTAIPVITVDAKGRITSASTAAISSSLTIAADSGSNDTVTIGSDTLTFAGTSNEVETTVSNNQIQIGLPSTISGLTTVSATNLQGALAGTVASATTGTTQAASDNSTKLATTAYVTTAVSNLVDSAPGALNTLNELAAALGDDANFSTTVTNSIATKLPLAGGTLTGNVIFGDNVKALFGTGSDLEIYHDGSNSYLVDAGTGGILYRGGTQTFQNAAGSKTMAVLNGATSVDLYYDNSKKFETTSGGIAVTGTATATTFSATTLTGTLSTAAQTNITSVGTLSSLTVSGALNATLATAAQTNITSLGTLTGLTVNGTANATTFVGALTGNVTGNVSGSAATVTGAAQTAITSVGTLSALTVSGDVTIDTSTFKVDSSNNRVGILNASPDVTLDIGSATDSIHIPVGTTAQRPGSPAAGYFRYNSSLNQFEGYTSAWGAIGGGGTNTFTHNVFTGDGSTTAFALSAATESENNLLVFIDGVFQEQGAYSIATSGGTTTLTMSAAPASGRKLVVYQVSAAVSGSNLNIDTMTGDGSDTTLTLSIAPVNENNTQVFFDGVYQNKSTYSISGTTLTFSTAPPTGVAVEVMTFTQTEVNVPVNDTIDTVHIKAGAVTAAKIESSLDLSSKSLTLPAVAVPSASTATTQAASDNTTKIATTAYVTTAIANLVDGAPGTLNTLNELAAALADDAAFSSTITTSLAAKANLAAPNFTGNVTFDTTTLTIDATNNRVGVGTASPAQTLHVSSTGSTSNGIRISNSEGSFETRVDAGEFYLYDVDDNRIPFLIDTSGNIGIGTTSPGRLLTVSTSGAALFSLVSTGDDNCQVMFGDSASDTVGKIVYDHGTNHMRFETNASEAMRIDSSGNVGINAAGASSASPLQDFQVIHHSGGGRRSTLYYNQDNKVALASLNASSTWENLAIEGANISLKTGGTTNTDAVVIDSDGKVGIGISSPGGLPLQTKVSSGDNKLRQTTANKDAFTLGLDDSTGDTIIGTHSKYPHTTFKDNGYLVAQSASQVRLVLGSQGDSSNNTSNWIRGSNTEVDINTAGGGFNIEVAGNKKVSLQSGGNFGIGETSPDGLLHVKKANCGSTYSADAADQLILENGSSAMIDIRTPNSNTGGILFSDNDARGRGVIQYAHGNDTLYINTASAQRLAISHTGLTLNTLASSSGNADLRYHTGTGVVSYDNSSQRFKDNIRDNTTYGLTAVNALQSRMFEYKDDGRTDVGFIAEEVVQVVPELVGLDDEGTPLTVDYKRFVSVLVKAVQEQQEMIEALQAEVAALKGE